MTLFFNVEYEVAFVPPRCRKLRYRREKERLPVEIKSVSGTEAPIAIIQTNRYGIGWGYDMHGEGPRGRRITYRWFDRRLFARCRKRCFCCLNGQRNRWATVKDLAGSHYYSTRNEAIAGLKKEFSSYLLIDDQLWEEIGEPRYVIHTLGLGGNHGCTDLSCENSYNSNISRKRYFRIDEEEKARTEARLIAERRRDTESFKRFDKRQYDRFEILIPEAVQLNPAKEHGDGDPFLNKLYGISEVGDPVVAGLLSIASLSKEMAK